MAVDRVSPLYISLHTADPRGGHQRTHEVRYAGYARAAVARTEAAWRVVASGVWMSVVNRAEIAFPECRKAPTRAGCWVRYVGLGTAARGDGRLLCAVGLDLGLRLESGVHVGLGCRPLFLPGAIQVAFDGQYVTLADAHGR